MSVGELFDGTVETAAGLTTDRHLVFDWELVEHAVDRRRHPGRDRERARRPSGRTAGRRSSSRTTTSRAHASRLADPIAGRRPRCRRPGRGGAAADACAGRRSCTTARSSGWATSTSRPTRASIRRPAAVGPDFAWWDRSRLPDADAVDRRVPAPGSRPAGRGCASAPDADDAQRRGRRRPTRRRCCRCYRRLIALRAATPGAPGRRRSGSIPDDDRRSRRLHPRGRRAGRSSWSSTSAASRRVVAARRTRPRWRRWRPILGTPPGSDAGRRRSPAAPRSTSRPTRRVVLERIG